MHRSWQTGSFIVRQLANAFLGAIMHPPMQLSRSDIKPPENLHRYLVKQ